MFDLCSQLVEVNLRNIVAENVLVQREMACLVEEGHVSY